MPNAVWKQFERRVSTFFGSFRKPLSGMHHRTGRSDSLHSTLFIEAKQRAYTPVYTLWEDTKEKATKEGMTPVVALHQKGRKGFLLVIHCDDLPIIYRERIAALAESGV